MRPAVVSKSVSARTSRMLNAAANTDCRRGDVGDPVADAGEEHRDGVRARWVAQEGDRGGGGGAEQAQEGRTCAVAVRAGQVLQRVGVWYGKTAGINAPPDLGWHRHGSGRTLGERRVDRFFNSIDHSTGCTPCNLSFISFDSIGVHD